MMTYTKIATDIIAATRQQDSQQTGVCHHQILLRRPGQEAQGHQPGTLLHLGRVPEITSDRAKLGALQRNMD